VVFRENRWFRTHAEREDYHLTRLEWVVPFARDGAESVQHARVAAVVNTRTAAVAQREVRGRREVPANAHRGQSTERAGRVVESAHGGYPHEHGPTSLRVSPNSSVWLSPSVMRSKGVGASNRIAPARGDREAASGRSLRAADADITGDCRRTGALRACSLDTTAHESGAPGLLVRIGSPRFVRSISLRIAANLLFFDPKLGSAPTTQLNRSSGGMPYSAIVPAGISVSNLPASRSGPVACVRREEREFAQVVLRRRDVRLSSAPSRGTESRSQLQ